MQNSRTPIYQEYYDESDYDLIMQQLPEIMKKAEKKASEILEPTIFEKRKTMDFVKDYIRKKGRKVYGGTAINELIMAKNPNDGIYDKDNFSDIEFYSPTPVLDLVELCDLLYKEGFNNPEGAEAQHEGTYKVFVNYAPEYCDITYVPTHIYNGIRTIEIDGINYVDPHFIWIDQLRIFNDPMTSSRIWAKTFDREYKLLKYYPLEHFDKKMSVPLPDQIIRGYHDIIKKEFIRSPEIINKVVLCGYEAYNFYVKIGLDDKNVEKMARIVDKNIKLDNCIANVPFIDIVALDYKDVVTKLHTFLKSMVDDTRLLTSQEFFPLFQFRGYSIIFFYDNQPLIRVIDNNSMCIPNFKLTSGVMVCTFQYIIMAMLINKFKSFLDRNKDIDANKNIYFNYSMAISNLVKIRNYYLEAKKITVLDKSPFSEFKLSCVGTTMSFERQARLRRQLRIESGKNAMFRYKPEDFFKKSEEDRGKFDPGKYKFSNTSGNIIIKKDNLRFHNFEGEFNDQEVVEDVAEETN